MFYNCTSLYNITIPGNVVRTTYARDSISTGAF